MALAQLTDDELTEKCEGILTKKIRDGDKQAIFQLGQLHFELVGVYVGGQEVVNYKYLTQHNRPQSAGLEVLKALNKQLNHQEYCVPILTVTKFYRNVIRHLLPLFKHKFKEK